MSLDTSQIGNRAWSFAHVLRDDGLSYQAYIEQITYLLFLKMADEVTKPPYDQKPIVPAPYDWPNLVKRDGVDLEAHYRKTLEELGKRGGMLGTIFLKAKNEIADPAKLRRLIVDLIDRDNWMGLGADVKGTIYEELLQRSAAESPKGAGQYFTPRPVIEAVVDVMQPTPDDGICDPAAGTGGFLLAAYQYVIDHHGKDMNRSQLKRVKEKLVEGMELVPNTARLCAMNLYLHGIGGDDSPVHAGHDSLAKAWGRRYSMVLTNPPFGKKSSVSYVNEDGELEKEKQVVVREDFWAPTSNKQLNFVQHINSLLAINGRAAVVVPDNVLFEGGAGEKVRRQLLTQCDVHTLIRLPTGIWYSPGVKANVIFFDKKPGREQAWTSKLWVYDLRTNMHFTLKQDPIRRRDFDEFVACYKPGAIGKRKATWDEEKNPDGRWRCYDYEDLLKRDKVSLDLFWLRDESLEDGENLPEPDVLATEIADDLQAALEQFNAIANDLEPGA
ncbi:MAG: SAM-dependent DNA methyltransferase [Phycisphaerae bacterium]|nr:SAM-dependent DNA methyltransferase [Phycisphaerae bacterium]